MAASAVTETQADFKGYNLYKSTNIHTFCYQDAKSTQHAEM